MSIANALKLAGGVVALAGTFYFARKQIVGKKAAVAREKQEIVAELQDDLNALIKWAAERNVPLTEEEDITFAGISKLTFESDLCSITSAANILKAMAKRLEEAYRNATEVNLAGELGTYEVLVTDGKIVENPELLDWIAKIRKRLDEHDPRVEFDLIALARFNLNMAAAKPAK